MSVDEWEYLPCNRQEGQPCPNGCIMRKHKTTGKVVLDGDCRAPYNEDCYLNRKEKEDVRRKTV